MLPKEKKLDPRVIRTRRDLSLSLCAMMREKAFNQITVQEITERALINRATFYAHFEDKFSLLAYMVRESFAEKLEGKMGGDEGFVPQQLRLLMLATCEFLAEFADDYAPRKGDEHPPIERQIQPLIYQHLLQWAEKSAIDKMAGQSAQTLAMVTSWAIFGSALQWSRGKREISADVLTEQVMSLLMYEMDSLLR